MDRKLDTEKNVDTLLTLKDPGALFILEIFSASLTQEDFDTFIQFKEIFSDQDILAAMRYVHPGLFTKHTQTILQMCELHANKEAKQAILEFVARENLGYARSKEHRACQENNFQLSGPWQWQPIDDWFILGVERNASQEEIIKIGEPLLTEIETQEQQNRSAMGM